MELVVASVTHPGRRTYNQDVPITTVISTPNGNVRLVAVFDGMGGMRAGDRASQLASQIFLEELQKNLATITPNEYALRKTLTEAALAAHYAVHEEGRAEVEKRGMGTTMVAALEKDGKFIVANVGDSRAYLWTPESNTLSQLTRDHSLREEAVRMGTLTREEAENSPIGHALTRSIGSGPVPEIDLFPEPQGWYVLPAGGMLVLCSDGLLDGIEDYEVRNLISGGSDANSTANLLLRAAYHGGSRDNITIVVLADSDYKPIAALKLVPPPMDESDEPATDPGLIMSPIKHDEAVQPPTTQQTPLWLIVLSILLFALMLGALWIICDPLSFLLSKTEAIKSLAGTLLLFARPAPKTE